MTISFIFKGRLHQISIITVDNSSLHRQRTYRWKKHRLFRVLYSLKTASSGLQAQSSPLSPPLATLSTHLVLRINKTYHHVTRQNFRPVSKSLVLTITISYFLPMEERRRRWPSKCPLLSKLNLWLVEWHPVRPEQHHPWICNWLSLTKTLSSNTWWIKVLLPSLLI